MRVTFFTNATPSHCSLRFARRRHTLSTRKIEAKAAALAAANATSSSVSSATKVQEQQAKKASSPAVPPAPTPLASSSPADTNFEEATEIDEELPTLGGEDISVIEMKPSTHKKKRKATRENEKRKR